ncbi:uncharacterized protein l(3)L1231 [Calliphora vicina]|uniref:uncharacterized protein l(3)L1231 n=1 Tax=Calliphora vicina TaxID=7373 RepID=UPI00325B5B67
MSCQQASRFITNSSNINNNSKNNHNNSNCKNLNNISNSHNHNNNIIIKGNRNKRGVVVQQEDPYVFTESVPTTPPILFNTQKTRTRLNDLTTATTLSIGKLQQQQQQKLPLTETNGKITSNTLKTQASFLSSSSSSTSSSTTLTTINTCTAPTSKTNVIQSLTVTTATANNNCNSKKLTNVCIVRPQLQQQQPHYHHLHQQHQNYVNSSTVYEGDLKSTSPPPLYTPPTPSLWQTPLLLETTTASTAPQVTNVVLSPKATTTTTTSQTTPIIMGCVTPTVQTVGSTTTTMNPSSLTTTAMAKVAPIIVHTPLAPPPPPTPAQSATQCLPPSKFHNHTLAQHLHKVECLKKSKKSAEAETILCNDNVKSITSPLKATSPLTSTSTAAPLKPVDNASGGPVKHSETEDLNEIPVNVIFRMAMVPQQNEKSSNNIQFVKPQTEIDAQPPTTAPPSSLSTQLKTNVNKKLSIPASKTIATNQLIKQQQINTSSIQHDTTNATTTTALYSQQHQTPNDFDADDNKISTNSETLTKINVNDDDPTTTIVKNLKTKTNSTHITTKTRKINSSNTTNLNYDLPPYNWQMGCSTTKGAVAIVKMSQHHVDLDTTHLATATGLPYCLQQYWLNTYDFRKSSEFLLMDKSINRSLAREERIAVYKQQLRRQAMQLLSTRSLQKLPKLVARRRLLCVDRLLRKYQQSEQNKKELPANVKRCCVNGCDAYTLEMASHCQQHIVYNSAQQVFLPCTAKFADNTQCRVPVFDITHDLPLCMEHARKRDAYNRLLYEQRPRKISTNPIIMNESIISTSKLSANNTINTDVVATTAATGGVVVKTQNYQHKQKQQQQQHVLQQLPANQHSNGNGNKRPTLVNQQARKRKMTVGFTGNPVGRPQKRVKKTVEKSVTTTAAAVTNHQMPRLVSTSLKRKSSTTSLESIASNSQHSTTSSTSQQQQQYQRQQPQHQLQQQHLYGVTSSIANANTTSSLPPPALAPLSGMVGHGLPQHLFSFGHDNHQQPQHYHHSHHQQPQNLHARNINDKHSFSTTFTNTATPATTASTPTELRDFISQFSFAAQKHAQAETTTADINLLNTNSNSNFTSSGMGSTTSLPTADDFLTQDMLSICENSSASSADTGLGGLSDPELMLGGPEDDIPLGDTHLLEEHDLENVLNSLPEDAFKELFTTVHQDESDEIERAIELADKHLKTLQQTIGSELGDFLDFNDDMLMDNGDLCNGSTANSILDTSALFIGGGAATVGAVATNATQGGGAVIGTDIRGLVQT